MFMSINYSFFYSFGKIARKEWLLTPLSTRGYGMEAKPQCSRRRRDLHGYVVVRSLNKILFENGSTTSNTLSPHGAAVISGLEYL